MKVLTLSLIAFFGSVAFAANVNAETLTVKHGQVRSAARGKVTVKFIAVLEDSRCPINARCIWAGNAKVSVRVAKGRSAPKTFELNSGRGQQSFVFAGYEFKYKDLRPWKGEVEGPAKAIERLTLTITKVH